MKAPLLERLHKLEALAARGVGGERENARRMLAAFRTKNAGLLRALTANAQMTGLAWFPFADFWMLGGLDEPLAVAGCRSGGWEWSVDYEVCQAERYSGVETSCAAAMQAAENALNVRDVRRPAEVASGSLKLSTNGRVAISITS